MASYNRVVLMGNLTRDPQLSYTASNTAICKFAIATNRKWKDRDGNMQEETCFVDCTLFGRGAETFNQYMSKGRSALVEGRLHLGQWSTPEGEKRSKLDVVVENFTFVGGGRDGGAGERSGGDYAQGEPAAPQVPVNQPSTPGGNDDIPF